MKSPAINNQVQIAQELHQRDQSLIKQHQKSILRLASLKNDPVEISCYLAEKHNINIRISTLRSFLKQKL